MPCKIIQPDSKSAFQIFCHARRAFAQPPTSTFNHVHMHYIIIIHSAFRRRPCRFSSRYRHPCRQFRLTNSEQIFSVRLCHTWLFGYTCHHSSCGYASSPQRLHPISLGQISCLDFSVTFWNFSASSSFLKYYIT